MAIGGFEVGRIFARLGGDFEKDDFDKYDKAIAQARGQKDVEKTLGAKVNDGGFRKFRDGMEKANQRRAEGTIDLNVKPAERNLLRVGGAVKLLEHEVEKRKELKLDTSGAEIRLKMLSSRLEEVERKQALKNLIKDAKALGLSKGDIKSFTDELKGMEQSAGGLGSKISGLWGGIGMLPKVAIAASPALMGLAGALTAVAGSAGAAAGGAGALGLGGLAVAGVGIAGIASVAIPAKKELTALNKVFGAYNKAVAQHGASSKQAAAAQKNLNIEIAKSGGPGGIALIKNAHAFSQEWQKATKSGRQSLYGFANDALKTARALTPMFSRVANDSTKALREGFQPVFRMFRGSEFQGIISSLGDTFKRIAVPAGKAFSEVLLGLGRIARTTTPYIREMVDHAGKLADHFASSTSNGAHLNAMIGGLVSQFRSWSRLIGATGSLLFDIFKGGARQGQGLVDSLTRIVKKTDEWLRTGPGQSSMKKFFKDSVDLTKQLFSTLGPIVGLLATVLRQMMPALLSLLKAITPIVTDMAKGMADATTWLVKLVKNNPELKTMLGIVVGLAAASKAISFVSGVTGLGRMLGLAKTLQTLKGGGGGKDGLSGVRGVGVGSLANPMMVRVEGGGGGGGVGGFGGDAAKNAEKTAAKDAEKGGLRGLLSRLGGKFGKFLPLAGGGEIAAAGLGAAFMGHQVYGAGKVLANDWKRRPIQASDFKLTGPGGIFGPQGSTSGGRRGKTDLEKEADHLKVVLAELQKRKDAAFNIKHDVKLPSFDKVLGPISKVVLATRNLNKSFAQMSDGSSKSVADLEHKVATNSEKIHHSLGSKSQAAKDEMGKNFGAAITNLEHSMQKGKITTKDGMGEIERLVHKHTGASFEITKHNFHLAIAAVEDRMLAGKISAKDGMTIVHRLMADQSKAGAAALKQNMTQGMNWLGGQMGRGVAATDRGMQLVRTSLGHELQLFGAKGLSTNPGLSIPMPGNAASGLDSHGNLLGLGLKALGGWIGSPGERGQDRELALLGRGEFVASGDQQPELQAALALAKALGVSSSGSLEELAQNRKVPHSKAFAKGGFVRRFAKGGRVVAASDFGGHNDPSAFNHPTASGKIANDSLVGYAELSNPPGSLGFNALGHLPMGTVLSINYNGKTVRAPKVDVGAGGPGIGGKVRAIDLTYAVAQMLGFPGAGLVGIDGATGGAGGAAGGAAPTINVPKMPKGLGEIGKIGQAALNKAGAAANAKLQSVAAAAGASGGGGSASVGGARGPKGIGNWNGIPVANWLVDALKWAQAHGGNTQVTSGYRPGFDPHAPSGSEHAGTQYPHGAIDFGDFTNPQGLANKMSFLNSLKGYGGPKPILPIGFSDFGHTSGTGHARGGFVGRLPHSGSGGFSGVQAARARSHTQPPRAQPRVQPHHSQPPRSQPHHSQPHRPQPHVGSGAPGFIGNTRNLGKIPDLTGGPKATNPRVNAFLGSIGLRVPRPGARSPQGGSFLQALVGSGSIPGLSPLDAADLAVAGNANEYTNLEQHLTAAEPGGQLSEADYGQLLGVRAQGLGLVTGEQRTVAGEFQTVSSSWMGRDKRLQALKTKRDGVLRTQKRAQDQLKRMQRQYAKLQHTRQGRAFAEADRVAGDLSKNANKLRLNMAARRAIHGERGIDAARERARIHAKYAPLIAAATGKGNRGRRNSLQAAMARELNALSGRIRGEAASKKSRLTPLVSEGVRLSNEGKAIHGREAKARRKYARDGWSGTWREMNKKWGLQDKINALGDEAKKLQGSAGAHTGIAGLEGEEAQLVTAANELVQRAQQLPDAVRQGQTDVAALAQQATTAQLLTPEQTNQLNQLDEDQALAALTPDTADDQAAATGIAGLWQNVLTGLQSRHAPPDLITQAAQNLFSAKQAAAAFAPVDMAAQVAAQMASFDQGRRDLFAGFGSNYVAPATLPGVFGSQLGAAAGLRNFGATGAGAASDAGLDSAGAPVFQQVNHYKEAPVDPHIHAQDSLFHFQQAFG